MKSPPLYLPFSLALFFTLFGTIFIPQLQLMTFSPFLAILYHRTTFFKALWGSIGCGLILDICSSQIHFGMHALALCLTTFFLYRQKRHFFEEKVLSLALFTVGISLITSLLHFLFLSLVNLAPPLNAYTFFTGLMTMGCVDALYALLGFSLPITLYTTLRTVQWRMHLTHLLRSFMLRKEE